MELADTILRSKAALVRGRLIKWDGSRLLGLGVTCFQPDTVVFKVDPRPFQSEHFTAATARMDTEDDESLEIKTLESLRPSLSRFRRLNQGIGLLDT